MLILIIIGKTGIVIIRTIGRQGILIISKKTISNLIITKAITAGILTI